MSKLCFLSLLLCGCSVRHLEGHDRYSEVCVGDQLELHLELGNEEITCDSPPSDSGQLQMKMAPSALLALPAELSVEDLIAVEWCSKDLDCVTAESGSLTLTAYEEGIALSGTYAFVLADGSRLEGDLAAQSCDYSPCS